MTFTQTIPAVLSKYATFTGRAARPEFWWWALFVLLMNVATALIDLFLIAPALGIEAFTEDTPQPLSALVSLGLLLPGLAVGARRLHDINRSGWWMLIILIPFIGALVLLWWCVKKGDEGENEFGPPPEVAEASLS